MEDPQRSQGIHQFQFEALTSQLSKMLDDKFEGVYEKVERLPSSRGHVHHIHGKQPIIDTYPRVSEGIPNPYAYDFDDTHVLHKYDRYHSGHNTYDRHALSGYDTSSCTCATCIPLSRLVRNDRYVEKKHSKWHMIGNKKCDCGDEDHALYWKSLMLEKEKRKEQKKREKQMKKHFDMMNELDLKDVVHEEIVVPKREEHIDIFVVNKNEVDDTLCLSQPPKFDEERFSSGSEDICLDLLLNKGEIVDIDDDFHDRHSLLRLEPSLVHDDLCFNTNLHLMPSVCPSFVQNLEIAPSRDVNDNSLAMKGKGNFGGLLLNVSLPSLARFLRYTSFFPSFVHLNGILFGSNALIVNRFWISKIGQLIVFCYGDTLCFMQVLDGFVSYVSLVLYLESSIDFLHDQDTCVSLYSHSPSMTLDDCFTFELVSNDLVLHKSLLIPNSWTYGIDSFVDYVLPCLDSSPSCVLKWQNINSCDAFIFLDIHSYSFVFAYFFECYSCWIIKPLGKILIFVFDPGGMLFMTL